MYGQLCLRLNDSAPNFEDSSSKTTVSHVLGQHHLVNKFLFRHLGVYFYKSVEKNLRIGLELQQVLLYIVTLMMMSFYFITAFDSHDGLTADEEEQRNVAKRKMLGNVKFIGKY